MLEIRGCVRQSDSMNTIYRMYVGARNGVGTFSPRDIEVMENTLNRYFIAWTWQDGQGYWNGVREESKIITVSTAAAQTTPDAGKTPIQSCANQLRGHFEQDAVLLEKGGPATVIKGKVKTTATGATALPAPAGAIEMTKVAAELLPLGPGSVTPQR